VVPCATLVNALAFHITPTLIQGRVAPGLFTAAFLYLPFSSWALIGAARDGVRPAAMAKAAFGGIVLAVGVVFAARAV